MSATAYDVVEYPAHAFAQTHPGRLATMATLYGMQPAPVERCRVLELGCGHGANLIPMALTLPEARFTGIDLAAGPVDEGRETIAALGLTNISLQAGDIMTITPEWGEFDYIITHGMYAWVPDFVRDQILRISKQNLAPNGVAFVSFNALPGCRIRQMIREMMLFHTRNIEEPAERIEQALALMQMVSTGIERSDGFTQLAAKEMEGMFEKSTGALFHDELGEIYEPVYFHEFAEHASQHGLQFLAEANLFDMQDAALTEDGRKSLTIASGGNPLLREQYLDFIKCRRFRQTLVCHAGVTLDRELHPRLVRGLFAASQATAVSEQPDLSPGAIEAFQGPLSSGMRTAHPIAKTALMRLIAAWPQTVSFSELCEGIEEHDELCEIVMAMARSGLIELHTGRRCLTATPSERPVASPLARYQAGRGKFMTTLFHGSVKAGGPLESDVVRLLDGTRNRAALIDALSPHFDPNANPKEIAQGLEASLQRLGKMGLLMT